MYSLGLMLYMTEFLQIHLKEIYWSTVNYLLNRTYLVLLPINNICVVEEFT